MEFSIHSKPRAGRGGGLAFIFKPCLKLVRNNVYLQYKSFEVSEANIKNQHECLRICPIYKPGTGNSQCKDYSKLSCFFEKFESYLDDISARDGKPILCGDFNFHLEDRSIKDAKRFCLLLESQGYVPLSVG